MSELRGALIGCGFFAVNQMNAWADIPGVRMVAICDRDEARLAAMGERFGIAPFVGGFDGLGKCGEIPLGSRIQGQHGGEQK